jgi:hypothetical protein
MRKCVNMITITLYSFLGKNTTSIHLAGKALENAAFILAQNLNQPQRAAEAYQRASNYFMTQGTIRIKKPVADVDFKCFIGSIDRAAEQLEKAGK